MGSDNSEMIKFQELTQISDIESLNSEDEYRLYEKSYKAYSKDIISVDTSESNPKSEIMEKSHPQLEIESSPEEVKNAQNEETNPPKVLNDSDIHVNFETTLTLDDDLSDSELTPTSPFLKRTKITSNQHAVPVSMPVTPILKNEYTPKCSRSLSRVQFSHEEYSDGSATKLIKSKSCLSNDRSRSLNRKRLNFGSGGDEKNSDKPLIKGNGEEADREASKESDNNNNKDNVENVDLNTSQLNSPLSPFLKNPRIGKRGRQMIEAASQKKTSS